MTPDQEEEIRKKIIEEIIPFIWANEDVEDYSLSAYSDDQLFELCMREARRIAKQMEDKTQ